MKLHKEPITAKQGCSVLAEYLQITTTSVNLHLMDTNPALLNPREATPANYEEPSSYRNSITRETISCSKRKSPKHTLAVTLNTFTQLKSHLLKGELLIVGLDAAHVVRGGGVQSLHEQMQRVAELKDKSARFEEGWRCWVNATQAGRNGKKPPAVPASRCDTA